MRDYLGSGLLAGQRALVTGGTRASAGQSRWPSPRRGPTWPRLPQRGGGRRAHGKLVEAESRRWLLIPGDLASEAHCRETVSRTAAELGGLDVLVLHHGTQQPAGDLRQITASQLERTFQVNVLSLFWLVQAAIEHMGHGSSIVVTGSINCLRGNKQLIDYAASKAAAMNLVQSLGQALADQGIRVNTVARRGRVDPADSRDVRLRSRRRVRPAHTARTARATGRDRPLVRVLGQQPDVLLLHRAVPGAARRRDRSAAEPDGEAVIGVPERDVDIELVHGPEPKSKSPVRGVAWSGEEACQAVGWAAAFVVNGDHDAARCGPDAYGRGRAAVALCVADCL